MEFCILKMIFLDSSFIIGYYNKDDEHNEKAVKVMKEIIAGKYGSPVISDYIFDEIMTVLFNKLNLNTAIKIGDNVLSVFDWLIVDENLFLDSFEIFKNQKNTKLSFTDCSNLALMKFRDVRDIATFDEDFLKIDGINVIDD